MEQQLEQLFTELVGEHFGPATSLVRAEPLAGDASTRRYARLWLSGNSAPPTTVAMILADRGIAMSSDELAVFKETPKELPYVNVQRLLERIGSPIPEIYLDASERGILLLEDIGDTPLWDDVQGKSPEYVLTRYREAIEELLRLQIDGTRVDDSSCLAFQQSFDERLYLWEFEHFIEYGVEKRLKMALPEREAALLRSHFTAIAKRLDAEPRVINHRDYHSWNLYVHKGRIRVIDFQDALLAAGPYDLATLLGDRDTPQVIRPEVEAQLLDDYRAAWQRRSGTPLDRANFEEVYFLCALQKALKVVGRFYFLDMVKGKPGYMRYVPSTVRQIKRILPRFAEHRDMAEVLVRYLPE